MKRIVVPSTVSFWLLYVACLSALWFGAIVLANACTPTQRTVVRTMVDIVEEVCPDAESVLDCLAELEIATNAPGAPGNDPRSGYVGQPCEPPDGGPRKEPPP